MHGRYTERKGIDSVSVSSRSYLFPNWYKIMTVYRIKVSVSSRSYLFPNPLFQTPVTLYIATGVCVLKKFRHNILNIFYKQTVLTTVFMRCAAKSIIQIILIYFFYSRNSAHTHLQYFIFVLCTFQNMWRYSNALIF